MLLLLLLLQLGGQLRSLHKLPVGYVALDWHQMDKELGSEALVEAFWTQLSALLPPQVRPTVFQGQDLCLAVAMSAVPHHEQCGSFV